MMKRWFAVLCAACCLSLSLAVTVEAAPPPFIEVKACGVSPAGDEAAARADAQRKAVEKTLSKMLARNDDPASVYQKMLANSRAYATAPDVTSKKDGDGGLELYSKVTVKLADLHTDVVKEVSALQRKHGDAQTGFLLRVRGLPAGMEDTGQKKVTTVIETTFQNLGFATDNALDELAGTMKTHAGEDYGTFTSNVGAVVHRDYPEITNAVLGEVEVEEIAQDADGVTVRGTIRLTGIDMVRGTQGTPFATAEEAYTLRDIDMTKVLDLFLYKAGLNAARSLEDQTLTYWQVH